MIKKLHFNNQFNLNACTGGQLLKIFLIHKISNLVAGNQKKHSPVTPQWRDFVSILLIHYGYPVFRFLRHSRSIISKLMKRP